MDLSRPRTPLQRAQAAMVTSFPRRCPAELPEAEFALGNEEKRLLFFADRAELYVFYDGLWNIKMRLPFPPGVRIFRQGEEIAAEVPGFGEYFSCVTEKTENESCFLRRQVRRNISPKPETIFFSSAMTYFTDGPTADFAYASYKSIVRGACLEKYFLPEFDYPHMSEEMNNQLFYVYSGNMYLGQAWLDTAGKWQSCPGRDEMLRSRRKSLHPRVERGRSPVKGSRVLLPEERLRDRFFTLPGGVTPELP